MLKLFSFNCTAKASTPPVGFYSFHHPKLGRTVWVNTFMIIANCFPYKIVEETEEK